MPKGRTSRKPSSTTQKTNQQRKATKQTQTPPKETMKKSSDGRGLDSGAAAMGSTAQSDDSGSPSRRRR